MRIAAAVLLLLLLLVAPFSLGSDDGTSLGQGIARHVRSLGFPPNSNMGLFFAVAIPLDIPDKSVSLSWYFEANYGLPSAAANDTDRRLDRATVYDLVEAKLLSHGYPGRGCLLRAICEAASFPFAGSGLLGDLLRILLTPSASAREQLPGEIEAAELATDCLAFDCPLSLLDAVSAAHY